MGRNDPEGHRPCRNESLADRYERERAGVSGDPSPDRTYGDEEDKSCGQDADRWRRKLRDSITATVFHHGKLSAKRISSLLMVHQVAYMGMNGDREVLPPEVIDFYAEDVDELTEAPDGEWVVSKDIDDES